VPATARIAELTEEQWAAEYAGQAPVQSSAARDKGKEAATTWADEYSDDLDLDQVHTVMGEWDANLAEAWASATRATAAPLPADADADTEEVRGARRANV
jgi:hypothetical protein